MPNEEPFNRWRSVDLWSEIPCQVHSYKGVQTITSAVPVRRQSMADVSRPIGSDRRVHPHPVEIWRLGYHAPAAAPVEVHSSSWIPEVVTWTPRPDLRSAEDAIKAWARQNRLGDTEEWRQAAFDRFSEIFPPEIEIANFAWEARELSSLAPKVEQTLGKMIGGSHLWWAFGMGPTLADLDSLVTLLSVVQDKIKFLRKNNGKTRKLRAKRKLSSVPALPPEIWWTRGPDGGSSPFVDDYWSATLRVHTRELRAVARLAQDLDIPTGLEGTVRGLIAATGLSNPLGIIWQGLPFSFLLDWVVDVGSVFRRHSPQAFVGKWEVSDFCISSKETWMWDLEYRYSDADNGRRQTALPMGGITLDCFERSVGWPNGLPVLTFPPSAGQAALLASLILAST